MPELPEVETARRRAHEIFSGRRILGIHTRPDPLFFEGLSSRRVASALKDRAVLGSGRKGKYFWLELDRRPWPLFHFGMSGGIRVYREPRERPPYLKLELAAETGVRVGWVDKRRLGRIRLCRDPLGEPPVVHLGFDALTQLPTSAALHRKLRVRKLPIKVLLLEQSFSAGVGNWIADEVLFQAGVAPHRRAATLSLEEARRLRAALGKVIRHAVKVEADQKRFPASWLFHHRWGRNRHARTRGGHPIRFATLGGRTAAWVPAVQR